MSDKIELHGWNDLILPSEALLELTSRSYKLFGYYVLRARSSESCFPGVRRVSQDLTTDDEKWSDGTIKRANAELSNKKWVFRERVGIGKNSVTHVFRSKEAYDNFVKSKNGQITSDPTDGSPVIPQTDHPRSDSSSTQGKENSGKTGGKRKPRNQNLIFNAIGKGSFGVTEIALLDQMVEDGGSRCGIISGWLKKTEPDITVERVERFYQWHDAEREGMNAPRDLKKFQEAWREFSQSSYATAPAGQPIQSRPNALSQLPPEPSEEERRKALKILEEARHGRNAV